MSDNPKNRTALYFAEIQASRARQREEAARIEAAALIDSIHWRLHVAGWHIGDVGGPSGWIVYGRNGENVLVARGQTQSQAWQAAAAEAERLGMYGRSFV